MDRLAPRRGRSSRSRSRAGRLASATSLIATGLLLALTARGEEPWFARFEHDRAQTNAACHDKRFEACVQGLRALLPLVDGRPDIQCALAAAQEQLGQRQAAAQSLRVCARSQLDLAALISPASLAALKALPGWPAIEADAHRIASATGTRDPRFTLDDPDLLTEDMAYEPVAESFFVSSVRERKIVRIASDGVVSDFISSAQIPAWGIFALVLDPRREVLWATTTALAVSPPYSGAAEDGRSAVLRIDLRSHTLLGRYELADGQPHAFGDMTLGLDGGVFVADGRGGGVYSAHAGRLGLEVVVSPGLLHSPQTPALSSDGTVLLVPDYTRGIARVRLSDHELTWLQHPPELALFGVDGFYWRGHTLVAVQNGTAPERILIMRLDGTCTRIAFWHVALARVPELGDPTHGLLRGRDFYFLANSGWDRFDDAGHPIGSKTAAPAAIWRLRLPADVLTPAACAGPAAGQRHAS